jgi:hypothetical protein
MTLAGITRVEREHAAWQASLLFDPDPKPEPDLPHWLIVKEWGPPDWRYDLEDWQDDLLDIEHHPDCPTEHRLPWPDIVWEGHSYWVHTCIFQQMVDDAGIDSYFQHRDDPAPSEAYRERVAPGRWPIEPWFETYHGHEGDEYDAGLRVSQPGRT